MDQRRLLLAIAASLAILLGWQYLVRPYLPHPPAPPPRAQTAATEQNPPTPATPREGGPAQGAETAAAARVPANVPRIKIAANKVSGSLSLLGARLDDLVLDDYRDTISPTSPHVRLLEPPSEPEPYYVQYGWLAGPGETVKLPGDDTVWTASADALRTDQPVTLSWDNGVGLTFQIVLSVDDNYMFHVEQRVKNATGAPVTLYAYTRVRRDYQPPVAGYYVLFEGMLGVAEHTLHETKYAAAKSEGEKNNGIAWDATTTGGWAGFTDKYWLTALVPNQDAPSVLRFIKTATGYQVDSRTADAQTIAPGATATADSRVFAGAKVVSLLRTYESRDHIVMFDYAIDWGWFWFFTQPIFLCLDWLNTFFGNFGIAILIFTVAVKAVFFPLANYSYRSMGRMKLLAPKVASLKERYKDDPAKMQSEMMALYREEKVNPASGCLPMLLQVPVFFSLYKVIFVTIEMRQAPFFGWIQDLSQPDPTNVFNLFGLLPFDPGQYSHFLHLGAWPLIMGGTMYLQQMLNPAPPDPTQARLFKFMPFIFMFMLANFPAGLVIYWSWNNLLSVAQQWVIQRRATLPKPNLART
ncbi:MAG TPA: membrane protein insertase YidC [Acidisphaera sp.]|nr:membrane protein insertase YidC [Acidisphaera sp.]